MEQASSADGIFLRVDSDVGLADVRRAVNGAGLEAGSYSLNPVNESGLYYVTPERPLPLGEAWPIARSLSADPLVAYAEVDAPVPGIDAPRYERSTRQFGWGETPNKPCSKDPEWSLKSAGVLEAWKLKKAPRGKDIRIGHPDTGYRRHPEIDDPDRLLADLGYDFKDRKRDPLDPLERPSPGHGTATASVFMSDVGSTEGDPQYVGGVAPAAEVVPFRVSSSVIHFNFGNVVKSIYAAISADCHIVSMSLGGPFGSRALAEAVRDAQDAGLILLGAAGNVYKRVIYPARIDTVIAVAASNCDDRPWRDSARGRQVDITAPGESVWRARTSRSGDYDEERSSGTSYAVATTAGICALWLSYHGRDELIRRYGRERLARVFQQLLRTEGYRPISNWDTERYGPGIIDAKALLKAKLPKRPPIRSFAPDRLAGFNLNTVEELSLYFPDVPVGRITEVMQKTLGATPDDFFDVLADYGDEFRFHCASNEAFRRSLLGLASPGRRTLRGFRGRSARTNSQLQSQASPDFLARLNAR
ncbi:S8 family peptidase [Lentisalinibacter salinarum]|uniref:S8 family peptidase n=1 Tax=Lentisalinibacter salinarum TaxID=2992239 RepID=UPI00386751D2